MSIISHTVSVRNKYAAHCSNRPSLVGECENIIDLGCMGRITVARNERYPRRGRWMA